MELSTPLRFVVGIGPTLAKKLEYLELFTIEDLIHYYPFRYDDFSKTTSVLEAKIGESVTLVGEIWSIQNVYTRFRKVLTKAIFNDGTSPIELTWFNSPWLIKQLQVGDKLQISGKVKKYKERYSIVAPVWEKLSNPDVSSYSTSEVSGGSLHTGRLVPIYSETYGLTSKWLRGKIASLLPKLLPEINDPLPEEVKNEMLNLDEALNKIHFPENWEDINKARKRLGFDELFYIQLATQKARSEWKKKPIIEQLTIELEQLTIFIKKLPFELTNAQKKVIKEILEDLEKTQPMNRLIQGEVGSGKTVVAAIIAYITYLNNLKTLFMAPTEILAFQHYSTLQSLLEPFGIRVGIYTGSRKFTAPGPVAASVSRRASSLDFRSLRSTRQDLSSLSPLAAPDIIIGTHALLSDKLPTENVGLIIVDEQQRFGVEQRSVLRNKASVPHFLTMTATPIPRTVALTLYGDLDISIIDEMPIGRKLVKTHFVPSKKRADAYKFITKKVKEGGQVYIITPLIEESETLTSVKAAKVEFERLKKDIFPEFKLGLLHGRLKSKEKEEVINAFRDKKIDILVSTSVVEVGMDIPNATIMVIEGAERFGLAQLHQLRGRVGRGSKESFCFLFTEIEESSIVSRLKNLEKIYDGLKLSELDLKIRGGGEIFGTRQSGRFELKIASLTDLATLEKAREGAKEILEKDPTLEKHPKLKVKLANLASGVMPD